MKFRTITYLAPLFIAGCYLPQLPQIQPPTIINNEAPPTIINNEAPQQQPNPPIYVAPMPPVFVSPPHYPHHPPHHPGVGVGVGNGGLRIDIDVEGKGKK